MGRPPNLVSPNQDVSTTSETPQTVEINSSVNPISTEALLTLIASMSQQLLTSQQAQADANARLAEAILKTTEPREVLKSKEQIAKEANDKIFDDNAKELKRRQRESIKYEQNNCEHIAGCNPLSEERDVRGRSSILWHRTDAQVTIGICTNCQRFFRPNDPVDMKGNTYEFYRRKPSINRISASGTRQFLDPKKAMEDSFLQDS
jgi:hypothetical protein